MIAPAAVARLAHDADTATPSPRHSVLVRLTHWITVLCFVALLVSGIEILLSHPRFYWGETGNVLTPSLFDLPVPSSRSSVDTGYGFVLNDQNGWSRALHFQTAWVVVVTGLLYALSGVFTRHFQNNLLPAWQDLSWPVFSEIVARHLRFKRRGESEAWSYNAIQRLTYLLVIFVLFPLVIWTGLAMSPAFASVLPMAVTVFGGQQSARTMHFFISVALVLFVIVHITMVCVSGFGMRMRAMITGRVRADKAHA